MKTLVIIFSTISLALIGFLFAGIYLKEIGMLIAISTILFLALVFFTYYLSIYFINKSIMNKINSLQLSKLEMKQEKLIKAAVLFPYVLYKAKIQLVSIYILKNKLDLARNSLIQIKTSKIKDKSTLLEYFLTSFDYSLATKSINNMNYYSTNLLKIIDRNPEIEHYIDIYKQLINYSKDNNSQIDKEMILSYYNKLKSKINTNFSELNYLYIKKLLKVTLSFEENKQFTKLSKNTIFENI